MPTKKKTINDLVADIQGLLDRAAQGPVGTKVSKAALKIFKDHIGHAFERALKGRDPSKRKPKVIYMTELGKCPRKVWYSQHEPEKAEPLRSETILKFLYGDLIEAVVLACARAAGHHVDAEQGESEIVLDAWKIRGRRDATIDGELVDIKSASSRSFEKFLHENLGDDLFGYEAQIQGYAEAEDVPDGSTVSFVAVDKQHGHICRMPVPVRRGETIRTAKKLIKILEADAPPPRPYNDKAFGQSGNRGLQTACSYCEFKEHCWKDANGGKGLRKFVYSRGPVWLTKVKREPNVPEES